MFFQICKNKLLSGYIYIFVIQNKIREVIKQILLTIKNRFLGQQENYSKINLP